MTHVKVRNDIRVHSARAGDADAQRHEGLQPLKVTPGGRSRQTRNQALPPAHGQRSPGSRNPENARIQSPAKKRGRERRAGGGKSQSSRTSSAPGGETAAASGTTFPRPSVRCTRTSLCGWQTPRALGLRPQEGPGGVNSRTQRPEHRGPRAGGWEVGVQRGQTFRLG